MLGTKDKPPGRAQLDRNRRGLLRPPDHRRPRHRRERISVYRSSDAQPALARIATLSPNDGNAPLTFDDPGKWGQVTYAVAAFNAAGEASSNPVSLEVADPACVPPEAGQPAGGDQGGPPVPPEAAGDEQVTPPPSTNPDLAAPAISVAREPKCAVALSILDQSTNEDGFHVYRQA